MEQLGRANNIIHNNTYSMSDEQLLNALAECQQNAISAGKKIDESEGEGTDTVHLLEEYCEELYKINCRRREGKDISDITKYIDTLLENVKKSIKFELPDSKKEVVFLPYKASMWDSLESVWLAADADENCDAYVIPIPYYDKNPDGSLAQMHYEGDLYPDYVPVIHYDDYNFEEHHPDIIFIHNPYDEFNHVTSVHPFFYSKNLKRFTERLTYIPYFVLAEISPDNEETVERIQHFCLLPGVFNADKVIVQSEDMRQIYINVLTKATNGLLGGRTYWEEKILGLGSPKLDKLANTRKEDLVIPEEWKKIIQRPDGSRKKVILYNTSIDALLKNSDRMTAKIKNVLMFFKEKQDEAALLWRPHPLIKATIESMRPDLWQEYNTIVEQYRKDEWGIYDDTSDMDRAIVISDAYYGDASSLVQLYKKTGKPVMIQNVDKMFFGRQFEHCKINCGE